MSEQRVITKDHNQPPELVPETYRDELLQKTRPLYDRHETLVRALNDSSITDEASLEKLATLAGLIRDHRAKVEAERVETKKPWDIAAAAVQSVYRGMLDPLDEALKSAARMVDEWKAKERKRLQQEQEEAQRKADEERRKAEEAAAALEKAKETGDPDAVLEAELELMQHQGAADALDEATPAITPNAPIRTQTGMAASRTNKVITITDLKKCLNWLFKFQKAQLTEAVTPLVGRAVRGGMTVDGVSVTEESKTHFRR
jgi:hypothetical protein